MTMHGPGNSFDPMKSELIEDGAFVYNFPEMMIVILFTVMSKVSTG